MDVISIQGNEQGDWWALDPGAIDKVCQFSKTVIWFTNLNRFFFNCYFFSRKFSISCEYSFLPRCQIKQKAYLRQVPKLMESTVPSLTHKISIFRTRSFSCEITLLEDLLTILVSSCIDLDYMREAMQFEGGFAIGY